MPYIPEMSQGRPANSPRTEFGQRLFELRERRGFTQGEVAEKLGVTPRAYAFWERKTVAIHAEQIAKLAEIFEVSADLIVGLNQPQKAKRNGPKGKLELLFEQASQLPRPQQIKVASFLEPLVRGLAAAS